MKSKSSIFAILLFSIATQSCVKSAGKSTSFSGEQNEVKLIILAPGHFHAALVQKISYPQVAKEVSVYAPDGDEVKQYLQSIEDYNSRPDNPTSWEEKVYIAPDFLKKMETDNTGNVVVLAGNNQDKTAYIKAALQSGKNVLADKPIAINSQNFETLKECFETAAKKNLLLYDIMTERYEITSILQKEFSQQSGLFGVLQKGTPENPAIVKESVHHFSKQVSGKPLIRPAWFFDVEQQGEGMVDVSTHLIDLIQWACFPDQIIDYTKDIQIIDANRYPTVLTPDEFKQVTGKTSYPDYMQKYINNGNLEVYANGNIIYALAGIHARISVRWNFAAPAGGSDTHYSIMRGTKADLIIKQDKEQNYIPSLYVESNERDLEQRVAEAVKVISKKYEGVEAKKTSETCFEIVIPQKYHVGHEAHFGEVTQKYLQYLVEGKLPAWEVPNMIAKYYTTTRALEIALQKNK
jgi:predicted dehydrogenase